MKVRRSVLVAAVLVLVLTGLLVWRASRRPRIPEVGVGAAPELSNERGPAGPPRYPVVAREPEGVAPRTNLSADAGQSSAAARGKREDVPHLLSAYNDKQIVFYGKLEDQFGGPVGGAVVEFSVRYNNGYDLGVKRGQVVSDSGGFFTISGYTGESLTTNAKKLGYALASTNGAAKYSELYSPHDRAQPDPANPVVIKMWKLQGAEPLTSIGQSYRLPYNPAPMYFDLLAREMVASGGDVKITVSRAPGSISGGTRPGWSVRIEAVDGGLMDSAGREPITYSAPTEGYEPSIAVSFPPDAWAGAFSRGFFAVSRGAKVFSKLSISFRINSEPDGFMYLSFGGVASTNGSRNWEGDPNTLRPP